MKAQRIFLLGGGHTHVLLLKNHVSKLSTHKLTLVSSHAKLAYTGMLPGFIAGHYKEEDMMIDLSRLCERGGVEFMIAKVIGVNEEVIQLSTGEVSYDVASLNMGIKSALPENSDQSHSLPLKETSYFMFQWRRIYPRLKPGSRLAVVGGGAAGVEIALALAWRLPFVSVVLIAGSSFLSGYAANLLNRARTALDHIGVELKEDLWATGFSQGTLYTQQVTAPQKKCELAADYVFWCVHGKPAVSLHNSPFTCDERGFVRVNSYFQSVSHPRIFAVGDIAGWPGLEKSGVYAVRQAPFLAENLSRWAGNRPLIAYQPQKDFLKLLSLGEKKALGQRGKFQCAGTWVWYWKRYLDRKFVKLLTS